MDTLESILRQMEPVSLEAMGAVKLMNRVDSKFPTNMETLLRMAPLWREHFYVQENEGQRIARYRSLYFDTPDAVTYTMHHNRRLRRQKVRQRIYVESNLAFLEIKNKKNTGRTKKKRMAVDDMELDDREKQDFAARHLRYDVATLHPALENNFSRITLVNRQKTERLTIDVDLHFHNIDSDKVSDLHDIAVIELKRDGLSPSPVLQMLRQLRIHPHGFSKYCMGQTLTSDSLRINRFKEKLREVNIIMKQ